MNGKSYPPEILREMVDEFNRRKKKLGPEELRLDTQPKSNQKEKPIVMVQQDDDTEWRVRLTEDAINKMFETAFKATLEMARESIAHLARTNEMNRDEVRVIVAGGSCRNQSLRSRIEELCVEERVPNPVFVREFTHQNMRSWYVHLAFSSAPAAACLTLLQVPKYSKRNCICRS